MPQVTVPADAEMVPLKVKLYPLSDCEQLLKVTVLPLTVVQALLNWALVSAWEISASRGKAGTPDPLNARLPRSVAKLKKAAPLVGSGEELKPAVLERSTCAVLAALCSDELGDCAAP